MKILLYFGFMLAILECIGQRVVENPHFNARTTEIRNIVRIELTDTATVLYIDAVYRPHWLIMESSKCFIRPSEGGEKLEVRRAEGIALDKRHVMPESGKDSYKLIFPVLPSGVTHIDFLQEEHKGIFDIALTDRKEQRLFPERLKGNWLKADGSGEWKYSFEDEFAVADNTFWEYAEVKTKGRHTIFSLKNGEQEKTIYATVRKDGQVEIGTSKKTLEPMMQKRMTHREKMKEEPDGGPLLKHGKAVLKGFIKGYSSKMGEFHAEVYVDDIFSGKQRKTEIPVSREGCFEIEVELNNPQPVFMRFPLNMNFSVFMEPEKTTFMCLDMAQYIDPYREKENVALREKTSLFMGDNARVNYELQGFNRHVQESEKIYKDVYGMTLEQYKRYFLSMKEELMKELKEYEEEKGISKRGKELLSQLIGCEQATWLWDCDYILKDSWNMRNERKKPEDREPFVKPEVDWDYYDFVREMKLGDEKPVIAGGSFETVINRLRFEDVVRQAERKFDIAAAVDELIESGVQLTEEEKEFFNLVDQLNRMEKPDTLLIKKLNTDYAEVSRTAGVKYMRQINKIGEKIGKANKEKVLESYFGIKPGFVTEVMTLQGQVGLLERTYTPFTDQELKDLQKGYTIPFLAEYLARANDKLKAQIEENKKKSGYTFHETPRVEKDKLFDAIIEPFKGKVIFIDFWATWCAPCRKGIQEIKGVKKELAGQDIAFVYITGETSPLGTYNSMIPEIQGEHFRVSDEQWQHLREKFSIKGIPHYLIIDKSGKIHEIDFQSWQEASHMKAVLLQYLNENSK